jgi:hypothetical protein
VYNISARRAGHRFKFKPGPPNKDLNFNSNYSLDYSFDVRPFKMRPLRRLERLDAGKYLKQIHLYVSLTFRRRNFLLKISTPCI